MKDGIPEPTVRRLSAYMRKLEELAARGVERVSSRELSENIRAGPDMVRRDLCHFGQFGRPGLGYDVGELMGALRIILGTQRQWNVIIVGAGDLGHALMRYPGFVPRGFNIVAAFDDDPEKIGTLEGKVRVHPLEDLEVVIARHEVRLAILAVPAEVAQSVTDRLHEAGVQGILNFAPSTLLPVDGLYIDHVDISGYLEHLCFRVSGLRP